MERLKFNGYYVSIGLEIHVALNTKEKLFSTTKNQFENNHFDIFDFGMCGALPILNQNYDSVKQACLFGLATYADINQKSSFDRKHYFYPDLAIGYQITQQYNPILKGGYVDIVVETKSKNATAYQKRINIEHAHLECDAAKSLHMPDATYIDISRGGSPLLEIVSDPVMHSPQEARAYANKVFEIVKFYDICDGKIQEGSFRVDASISLCKEMDKLGTRVEIKNISSFKYLEDALNYEIERQSELLDDGLPIKMETRLYDEKLEQTIGMRDKETATDYRYLPDPDIPIIEILDNDMQLLKEQFNHSIGDYQKLLNKIQNVFKINELETTKLIEKYKQNNLSNILFEINLLDDNQDLSRNNKPILFKLFNSWLVSDNIKEYNKPSLNQLMELENIDNLTYSLNQDDFYEMIINYQKVAEKDCDLKSLLPKKEVVNDEQQFIIMNIIDEVIKENNFNKESLIADNKLLNFTVGQVMKKLKSLNSNTEQQAQIKITPPEIINILTK